MNQAGFFRTPVFSFILLVSSIFLSACSTVSDVASDSVSMFSNLNPFGSAKPAADEVPAEPPATIRVENGASVSIKMASASHSRDSNIEATVGDNTQCTTFCALPLRKPPVAR